MFWPEDHNSTGEPGKITIHQAAANDDVSKVSKLLDGGVDIHVRDQKLRTPLHCAISSNSAKVVRLLLARGADTTLRDNGTYDDPDGFTAMECAVYWNAIAAMQELITHGVDIESSNAVYYAARDNYMDMLQLLFDRMSAGMSDAFRRKAISDALYASAKNESIEMIQFLLQKLRLELQGGKLDDFWQRALGNALLAVFDYEDTIGLNCEVRFQDWDHAIQVMDILLKAGASVDAYGATALECALFTNGRPLKVIKFLLDRGADVNFCENGGPSPFNSMLNTSSVSGECFKMFLDAGGEIGPPDANGSTPLHGVIYSDTASWLLASGADISALDNQGEIPLHKACSMQVFEVVSVLLDGGSPVNVRNNLGWTPLMKSRTVDISKALLDKGADIHVTTELGMMAIHHATYLCIPELVSFLLANGGDVHARATREVPNRELVDTTTVVRDTTPLHFAILSPYGSQKGHALEVVTALLDHGANLEAKEGTGKTPLLLAISDEFHGIRRQLPNEKLINYLLERGADPYAVDSSGRNSYQLAETVNLKLNDSGRFERRPFPPQNPDGHGM